MIIEILGVIIGLLVFFGGIFYLNKEKEDEESKKIYGIAAFLGIIVAIVSIVLIIL